MKRMMQSLMGGEGMFGGLKGKVVRKLTGVGSRKKKDKKKKKRKERGRTGCSPPSFFLCELREASAPLR